VNGDVPRRAGLEIGGVHLKHGERHCERAPTRSPSLVWEESLWNSISVPLAASIRELALDPVSPDDPGCHHSRVIVTVIGQG
jgi:hypothetical protein